MKTEFNDDYKIKGKLGLEFKIAGGILLAFAFILGSSTAYTELRYGQTPMQHYVTTTIEKEVLTESTVLNDYIYGQVKDAYVMNLSENNISDIAEGVNAPGLTREEVEDIVRIMLEGDNTLTISDSLYDYIESKIFEQYTSNPDLYLDTDYIYSAISYDISESTTNAIKSYLQTHDVGLSEEEVKSLISEMTTNMEGYMSKNDTLNLFNGLKGTLEDYVKKNETQIKQINDWIALNDKEDEAQTKKIDDLKAEYEKYKQEQAAKSAGDIGDLTATVSANYITLTNAINDNYETLNSTINNNYETLNNAINTTNSTIESNYNDLFANIEDNYDELNDTFTNNYTTLNNTVTDNYNELSGDISDLNTSLTQGLSDTNSTITGVANDLNAHIENYNTWTTAMENTTNTLNNDLNALGDRVTTNETNIANNTANIATNATNISTNADNIQTNTDDIADINSNLITNVNGNEVTFQFVYNAETGEYGYKDGADTFVPFKTDDFDELIYENLVAANIKSGTTVNIKDADGNIINSVEGTYAVDTFTNLTADNIKKDVTVSVVDSNGTTLNTVTGEFEGNKKITVPKFTGTGGCVSYVGTGINGQLWFPEGDYTTLSYDSLYTYISDHKSFGIYIYCNDTYVATIKSCNSNNTGDGTSHTYDLTGCEGQINIRVSGNRDGYGSATFTFTNIVLE